MRFQDVELHAKKLMNCAACWTSTKGTGDDKCYDDQFCELVLRQCTALFRMDLAALSMARRGGGGDGDGCDESVPARIGAICSGRECACADAGRAGGYVHSGDASRQGSCRKILFARAHSAHGRRQG